MKCIVSISFVGYAFQTHTPFSHNHNYERITLFKQQCRPRFSVSRSGQESSCPRCRDCWDHFVIHGTCNRQRCCCWNPLGHPWYSTTRSQATSEPFTCTSWRCWPSTTPAPICGTRPRTAAQWAISTPHQAKLAGGLKLAPVPITTYFNSVIMKNNGKRNKKKWNKI
jgi:hypothetical protein